MAVKKLSIKKHKGKLVIHKKGSTDGESAQEPETEELQTATGEEENKEGEEIVAEEVSLEGEGSDTDDGDKAGEGVGNSKKLKIKQAKQVIGKSQVAKVEDGVVVEEINEADELAEVDMEGHMANVGFSLARSINMGNFESLKVQVSINVPSLVDEDEIEGNFEFAKDWCEEKMNELVDEYTDEADEGAE